MRDATEEFITKLGCSEFPASVGAIYLYGSEANGVAHSGSDINLAIMSENPVSIKDRVKVLDILDDLNSPYEYHLVYFFKNVDNSGETGKGFVTLDVIKRGILVYTGKGVM